MPTHQLASYNKPPIVEAVIALHFATPLTAKEIDAFARKSKKAFPFSEEIITIAVNVQNRQKTSSTTAQKIGYKLSSLDRTRLIMVQPSQFGVLQQAPYAGWDVFYSEAHAHWQVLKKITKHKAISRVSTRYINRIDIPAAAATPIDLSRYFSVGLSLPKYAEAMVLQNFYLNCSLLHSNTQYTNVLQFAAVPSPLIDHLSFTIDIDVVTSTQALPQHEEGLWQLINSLRTYKNELFEACITDETRKLFQ
jgi:uncharacterized protein (TIGR04255 family)